MMDASFLPHRKILVIATTGLAINFFFTPHIRGLARQFDVSIVLNTHTDSYSPIEELPAHVHHIAIRRSIAPLWDVISLMQLIVLMIKERPDIIWAVAPKSGLLGMIAGAVAGVRTRVFVFQGEVWATKKGLLRWVLQTCDRVTSRCSTHLLAVSHSERDFLESHRIVPNGCAVVLGHGSIGGVDTDLFCPSPTARSRLRKEYGIPDDAIVALFVGRMSLDKGVDVLIKAWALLAKKHPQLWLILVGPNEGIDSNLWKHLDPGLQARCIVVGFVKDTSEYMAAADFLCLPSAREGFGVVIIEAGSAGIPTIASNIYGISDAIVDGQTGILFEVGNVMHLAEKMSVLTSNVAFRKELGNNARRLAKEKFSRPAVVERYVEYFCSLGLDA